jgi:peptidoglycan L-alanyl-D-glutamate endopeptidase CwlK
MSKPKEVAFTASASSRAKLATLEPGFRVLAEALVLCGHLVGLNVQVSSARRTKAEQDALYSIGRTKPGKKVTNAKFGQSAHNYGLAIDVFVLEKDVDTGKEVAVWTPAVYAKLWNAAVLAGLDKKGLVWAGSWKTFKEYVHFEQAGWKAAAAKGVST